MSMKDIMIKNSLFIYLLLFSSSVYSITIIGISGGAASGKTTLASFLKQKYPEDVTIISCDNYYYDMSDIDLTQRGSINFDKPETINFDLLYQHLVDLKQGKSIISRVYDYVTLENNPGQIIKPTKIIVIEGFLIFAIEQIRQLLDLKIFIETDDDVRLSRNIVRDQTRCNRTVAEIIKRWNVMTNPVHHQLVQPSKCYAEIIFNGNFKNDFAIEMLISFVDALLYKI